MFFVCQILEVYMPPVPVPVEIKKPGTFNKFITTILTTLELSYRKYRKQI